MERELQHIVNNTDFCGYVILDWDSIFGKTECPTTAAAMCLERARAGGDDLKQHVKAYSVGTMGKYHHTPGERYCWEYDWERAVDELMR